MKFGRLRFRRVITIAGLVSAWCGLWREISVVVLLSGLVAALIVTSAAIGTPSGQGGVRLRPLIRLLCLVTVDLVRSTVAVGREIITPTDYTEEAIVGVTLPSGGRAHLLLLVVAVTLTPGTAVVDVNSETGRLYVHLLHYETFSETTAHILRLASLAQEALPIEETGDVRFTT